MRTSNGVTFALIAVLYFILTLCGPASAQQKSIKACYTDFPPYSYRSGGNHQGLSIEIMNRIAADAGFSIEYQQLPWKRCHYQVAAGETDLALDSQGRGTLLCTHESASFAIIVIWSQLEEKQNKLSKVDLRDKKIGVASSSESIRNLISTVGAIPEIAPNDQSALTKLSFGRTDFAATELLSGSAIIRESGLDVFPLTPAFGIVALKICATPASQNLIDQIDGQIIRLRRSGQIDKVYLAAGYGSQSEILKKYGPDAK